MCVHHDMKFDQRSEKLSSCGFVLFQGSKLTHQPADTHLYLIQLYKYSFCRQSWVSTTEHVQKAKH